MPVRSLIHVEDTIITKNWYSAFKITRLHALLQEQKISKLIIGVRQICACMPRSTCSCIGIRHNRSTRMRWILNPGSCKRSIATMEAKYARMQTVEDICSRRQVVPSNRLLPARFTGSMDPCPAGGSCLFSTKRTSPSRG